MAVLKRLDEVSLDEISALGLPRSEAARIHDELRRILLEAQGDPVETWKRVSRSVLRPEHPFSLHRMMFYGCYKDYGSDTPPAWVPDRNTAFSTNIGRLLQKYGEKFLGSAYKDPVSSFLDLQRFSVSNPEAYWSTIFDEMRISFVVPPTCILKESTSNPGGQWLPGAVLNAASNCMILNGKRKLDDVAIIWRDEGYDSLPLNRMTLNELWSEVSVTATAIETLGVSKGSAIAIDMPMTVTAVVIYLAIVSAGFVVVSIADSFAPIEISTRLKISSAKAIFTQDYIVRGDKSIPLYSRVVDADSPLAIVIPTKGSSFSRELRDGDISWLDFLGRAKKSKIESFTAVDAPVEAFTNILFSSGTTGNLSNVTLFP